MSSFVAHVTIDCLNAYQLSEWWKPVLDYVDLEGDPNLPGHTECMIQDREGGNRLLFIEVPEPKSVKNRVHLDVRPRSGTRDDEVERLRAYGATEVADRRGIHGPGSGWVVFADPEGNEFCVLRAESEVAAQA